MILEHLVRMELQVQPALQVTEVNLAHQAIMVRVVLKEPRELLEQRETKVHRVCKDLKEVKEAQARLDLLVTKANLDHRVNKEQLDHLEI